jgi:hypothetical protein
MLHAEYHMPARLFSVPTEKCILYSIWNCEMITLAPPDLSFIILSDSPELPLRNPGFPVERSASGLAYEFALDWTDTTITVLLHGN